MVKKLILALSLFASCLVTHAQTSFTVAGFPAYETVPNNFDTSMAYPIEVFFPGSTEGPQGLDGLKAHGPHLYWQALADSNMPMIIVSVSPTVSWNLLNSQVQAIITALKARHHVSRFYATGLSMGAQTWSNFSSAAEANFKQINGYVLCSTDAPPPPTPIWYKTDTAFWYGACGTADNFYSSLPNNMLSLYTTLSAEGLYWKPYLDAFQGVGHGDPVWSDVYNPAWISPAMGVSTYRKLISISPPPYKVNTTAPPVTPPPVIITTAPKTIKSILITYSDGSTQSLP